MHSSPRPSDLSTKPTYGKLRRNKKQLRHGLTSYTKEHTVMSQSHLWKYRKYHKNWHQEAMETLGSVEFLAIHLSCDHSSQHLKRIRIICIETGSMSGKMSAEISLFWLRHMVDSMSQRLCKHPEPAASNSAPEIGATAGQLPRSIKTTLYKTISTAMVHLHAVFLCFTRILSWSTEMFAWASTPMISWNIMKASSLPSICTVIATLKHSTIACRQPNIGYFLSVPSFRYRHSIDPFSTSKKDLVLTEMCDQKMDWLIDSIIRI